MKHDELHLFVVKKTCPWKVDKLQHRDAGERKNCNETMYINNDLTFTERRLTSNRS